MQEIQTKALQTYLENLEYLKIKDELLYNRINMLSNAIDDGDYKERYHIDYVKEDEQFDIYDSKAKSYLYDRKPNEFIKNAVKNSNLDKMNSIDLLQPNLYNNRTKFNTDDSINVLQRTTNKCANDIFDFILIFKKSTVYKKKQFKYLEKFIFAGSLLGHHMEPITKKLKFVDTFIYENNLEIFRLSLFVTNYKKLSEKTTIMFSVMDDETVVVNDLNKFYLKSIRSSYMLKYYSTNYNIGNFFDKLLESASQSSPFLFSYWKVIDGLLKPTLSNIFKYSTFSLSNQLHIFKNQPILLVAAGPSFVKNIKWMKENKDNFFIIAIGAVVKKLCIENIIPDLIISVDGDEIIAKQFPDEQKEVIENIPFLGSAHTHKTVLEKFKKSNIFIYEIMTVIKQNSRGIFANSIGEVSLHIASLFGALNIYLVGTDMALDQSTGASHSDTGVHGKDTQEKTINTEQEDNSFMKDGTYNFNGTQITVQGNFIDKVVTTMLYKKSISAYNLCIKSIKTHTNEDVNIYNLSDGAYLEGTIPMATEDVPLLTINKLDKSTLINSLNNICTKGLVEEEKEILMQSVSDILILENELDLLLKKKIKTYDDFILQRTGILNNIKIKFQKYKRYYLNHLFISYFFSIEPYLGFQLNDKDLKNEANSIKKVKKAWCIQMLNLCLEYKNSVLSNIDCEDEKKLKP